MSPRVHRDCAECGQPTRSKTGYCRSCDSTLWLDGAQRKEFLAEVLDFLNSENSLTKRLGKKCLNRDLSFWNLEGKKSLTRTELKVLRHDLEIHWENQKQ